jgi:hypothetical protein
MWISNLKVPLFYLLWTVNMKEVGTVTTNGKEMPNKHFQKVEKG